MKEEISDKVNNHTNFSKLADNLLELFPNSRIFATSGFLVDAYHGEEEHDYDPSIFGPSIERLEQQIKDKFKGAKLNENEKCMHFTWNKKTVDLHLLAPKLIRPLDNVEIFYNRYLFQLESDYPFKSYITECLNSDKITYSAGNVFAEYAGENVYFKNQKVLEELENKRIQLPEAERLRYSADPIFRTIKNGATGFEIESETYNYIIENNKLDYILWSDKKVERDLISLMEDKFLSTLLRVSREDNYDGSDSADFPEFVQLCENASILKSLFQVNIKSNKRRYDSKEEVILKIFETKKKVESVFGGNYVFENFYDF